MNRTHEQRAMMNQPTSADVGELIADDRLCTNCGYDLKGLRQGGVCPECGVVMSHRRRRSQSHEAQMGEVPKSYLYPLMLALMVLVLVGLAQPMVTMMLPGWPMLSVLGVMIVQLIVAGLWLGGLLVTMRRRPLENQREDQNIWSLEWIPLRLAALGTQSMWAVAAVVWWGSVSQSSDVLHWLAKGLVFVGVAGWPLVAWHLSFLVDWAGDTTLANRMRGAGMVLGTGSVLVGALYLIGWFSSGILFVLYLIAISLAALWALSYLLFVLSIAQMALMVRWARVNQLESDARDQRMAQKAWQEQERAERLFQEHDAPGSDPRMLKELERAQSKPLRESNSQGTAEPRSNPSLPQIERHGDGDPYDLED